jgi:serine/threonine-protein kinase RsbW
VITISLKPLGRSWGTISFASTLYLCPILDLLLADIPKNLQPEIRLGLQEALVNAAKHGNNLDPGKLVVVRFSFTDNQYPEESESGRGMSLLHQIFDQVEWNHKGTELKLCKQIEIRRFWHANLVPVLGYK